MSAVAQVPTAAQLEGLLARLDTLAWQLGRDEPVRSAPMQRLAEEAQALGPSLDDAGRRRLVEKIRHVTDSLGAACARIDERLGRLPAGRRAMRGYAANVGRR